MITKYTIEPMDCEIVLAICDNFAQVQKSVTTKKFGFLKKGDIDYIKNLDDDFDGILIRNNKGIPILLYVKKRKRYNWYFWDVLVHETNHLVYRLFKYYGFENETEYQATLQESLFRNFRRLILKK